MRALMVVLLYLTVWDYDTGTKLYESEVEVPYYSKYIGKMEACRIVGIEMAKKLTRDYRVKYHNASTNVSCRWEQRHLGIHK